MPLGSSALGAASALGALFGGSPPPPPASPAAPPAALQLVIQPGDGGAWGRGGRACRWHVQDASVDVSQ